MRTITCLVFLLISSGVFASDWYPVAAGANAIVQVDRQTIRSNGGIVKVWTKWLFLAPQELAYSNPKEFYQSSKNLELYNCKERSSTISQVTFYKDSEGGEVVYSTPAPGGILRFSDVIPDSMSEHILNFVCSQRKPKK